MANTTQFYANIPLELVPFYDALGWRPAGSEPSPPRGVSENCGLDVPLAADLGADASLAEPVDLRARVVAFQCRWRSEPERFAEVVCALASLFGMVAALWSLGSAGGLYLGYTLTAIAAARAYVIVCTCGERVARGVISTFLLELVATAASAFVSASASESHLFDHALAAATAAWIYAAAYTRSGRRDVSGFRLLLSASAATAVILTVARVTVAEYSWGVVAVFVAVHVQPYHRKPVSFQLVPRSSMSKSFFFMRNSIGVIDVSYRGSLKIPLWPLSVKVARSPISAGTAIVQLVGVTDTVSEGYYCVGAPSAALGFTDTLRGAGGFGSTGHSA